MLTKVSAHSGRRRAACREALSASACRPSPRLERNTAITYPRQNLETEIGVFDYSMTQALQTAFVQKGFKEVSAEATTTQVTLRGTVPKGKFAEAVRTAQEIAKRKIKTLLTEQ